MPGIIINGQGGGDEDKPSSNQETPESPKTDQDGLTAEDRSLRRQWARELRADRERTLQAEKEANRARREAANAEREEATARKEDAQRAARQMRQDEKAAREARSKAQAALDGRMRARGFSTDQESYARFREIRQRRHAYQDRRPAERMADQMEEAAAENRIFDRKKREADRAAQEGYAQDWRSAHDENRARDRVNPNSYFQSYLGMLRGRAQTAANNKDFAIFKQIEVDLKTINDTLKKRLANGSMSAGEAANARRGMAEIEAAIAGGRIMAKPGRGGSVGYGLGVALRAMNANWGKGLLGSEGVAATEGLAGEGLGALAMRNPYTAAIALGGNAIYKGARFAWDMPDKIAGQYQDAMRKTERFRNLAGISAQLGQRGGGLGWNYRNQFYNAEGAFDWQKRYGVDDVTAAQWIRNYGNATPASEAGALGKVFAAARYKPYMGLSPEEYIPLASQARTLGVVSDTPRVDGRVARQAYGFLGGGASNDVAHSTQRYLSQIQRVMKQATMEGLDQSRVATALSSLIGLSTSSGQATVNADSTLRFYNRLMTSGAPSMRSGEGILDVQSRMDQAVQGLGLGGNPIQNSAYHQWFAQHGGLPTSRKALERFYHLSYGNLAPGQKKLFDENLRLAQHGNELLFLNNSKDFLTGNDHYRQIAVMQNFVSGLPMDYQTTAAANGLNITPGQWADWRAGAPIMPLSPEAITQVHQRNARAPADVLKLAQANAGGGVSADALLSLWRGESGWDSSKINRAGGGKGAWGLGQLRQVALDDLKAHNPDAWKNVTLDMFRKDRGLGARASAEYLRLAIRENSGNAAAGLRQYQGDLSSANAQNEYVSTLPFLQGRMETDQYGDTGNLTPRANALQAEAGHAATAASEKNMGKGDVLSAIDPLLGKFDASVVRFDEAVTRLLTRMESWVPFNKPAAGTMTGFGGTHQPLMRQSKTPG